MFKIQNRLGKLLIVFLAMSGFYALEASAQDAPQSADQIAGTVMDWWNGDYDNDSQIEALRKDGAPIWQQGKYEEGQLFGGHIPVNSRYRPVSLPVFGDRVIYVEEKSFGDDPYRQRIYTLTTDEKTNDVRLRLWTFKDKEKYWGAWDNLSMLDDVTPEDMRPPSENCDLYVKPIDGGRLHMKMKPDICGFKTTAFDYQVILGPDHFWFRDRIYDTETGEVTMTAGSFTYHIMDKVN